MLARAFPLSDPLPMGQNPPVFCRAGGCAPLRAPLQRPNQLLKLALRCLRTPGLLFLFERLTLDSNNRGAHPRAKPRRERRRFGPSDGRAEVLQLWRRSAWRWPATGYYTIPYWGTCTSGQAAIGASRPKRPKLSSPGALGSNLDVRPKSGSKMARGAAPRVSSRHFTGRSRRAVRRGKRRVA